MNKQKREHLLAIARRLDRWALQIRAYVKRQTPKRTRKLQ